MAAKQNRFDDLTSAFPCLTELQRSQMWRLVTELLFPHHCNCKQLLHKAVTKGGLPVKHFLIIRNLLILVLSIFSIPQALNLFHFCTVCKYCPSQLNFKRHMSLCFDQGLHENVATFDFNYIQHLLLPDSDTGDFFHFSQDVMESRRIRLAILPAQMAFREGEKLSTVVWIIFLVLDLLLFYFQFLTAIYCSWVSH